MWGRGSENVVCLTYTPPPTMSLFMIGPSFCPAMLTTGSIRESDDAMEFPAPMSSDVRMAE